MAKTVSPIQKQQLQPLLVNSEAAGQLFGYSGRQMKHFAAEGLLPVVRLPGSRGIRFRVEALRQLAERFEKCGEELSVK